MNTIKWDKDAEGVVVLTLDDPNQSANTMNAAHAESIRAAVNRLQAEDDSVTGVVITSAKKTFFAGGDLNDLKRVTKDDADEFGNFVRDSKEVLRRLETLGKPVVAAINGAALGGGLEITLACHRRIIVDDTKAVVGFPEVRLGLLPGVGGVVRSVRMLGIVPALTRLLLQGDRLKPTEAKQLGLIDQIVGSVDELLPAAKAWIKANPHAGVQPWDVSDYKIPGGTPNDMRLAHDLPTLTAKLRKRLAGANYPAPHHIMAAAVESAQVDFATALEIEGRYFADLVTGQVAKNMIQVFFFDMQAVNNRGTREIDPWRASKVVVLGAGMMGSGIAYQCAKSGVAVVLKDVSRATAQKGKAYSEKLVAKGIDRGTMTQEEGDALLARIFPTETAEDAADADLVIEAVFEDPRVKAQVFAEVEPLLAKDALVGSNTSTLPITELAEAVTDPTRFIGLHFFSPVDRMDLIEIIKGEQTTDQTLSRALNFAKQIDKTPIVVNDSRGFFTSRVIRTYINEGIAMLLEGIPPSTIEQASSRAGYPAPVLQLSDELNMELMQKIRDASRDAVEADGGTWVAHPAERVFDKMVDQLGRSGRLRGAGFYDYDDSGKRVGLWKGLRDHFPIVSDPSSLFLEDLVERMLFAEALESVRCLDEGVIETVADGNIGSILGIGFPGWTGGVFQYMNGFDGGVGGFVARARELAGKHGDRFEPPASLVKRAAQGETYVRDPAFVST